jgi:uncharacterized protein (TIGR02145 family)
MKILKSSIPTITALFLLTLILCPFAAAQNTGSFTDTRDGKTYRTVKIGKQVWMAENLNYKTDSSWCYDNKDSNCKKYGRLYHWDAAMKACPVGWRLPTRDEMDGLIAYIEGNLAGTRLKDWNGTDNFGLSVLPGGRRNADGSFGFLGSSGFWWAATKRDADIDSSWLMLTDGPYMGVGFDNKKKGLSVRCLQD